MFVRPSVRPSVFQKKRDFSRKLLGGWTVLDSKHDFQLENSWIFMVPKKEVPSFALAVNHGWFEDPVFGSFLNTFGELFFEKVTRV